MCGLIDDVQLAKLPKYVQDEIRTLRRTVQAQKNEIKELHDHDTPTLVRWGWPSIGGAYGYLPSDETVFFSIQQEPFQADIKCNLINKHHRYKHQRGLYVTSDHSLVLRMSASNSVQIDIE